MQDLWIVSFFSDFFHEVTYPKVRKVTDRGFYKVQMGLKDFVSPQNEAFRALAKILSIQIYMLLCFNTEMSMVF